MATPQPPPKFRLRPYVPTDLSAISDISALCNINDELARYMKRDIHKYWTSYRAGCMRFLKSRVVQIGTVCRVCESISTGQVVGWVTYTREGTSADARKWQAAARGLGKAVERRLLGWEKAYHEKMPGMNPTRDWRNTKRIMPVLETEWDKEIFGESWELDGLCVHPDYYRMGIGRMLVMWGVERAREDGVPCVVHSSSLGKNLYLSCGFHVLTRIEAFDPLIPEFREGGEGPGCWDLVWEPEGGDWLDRAKRKKEEGKTGKDVGKTGERSETVS